MNEKPGKGLLILGSPRSGTSCTAGCVGLCGVSLGKEVSPVKDQYNEKGYFENQKILDFNRRALFVMGIAWHTVDLKPGQLRRLQQLHGEFQEVLKDQFTEPVFAIKDHRIALLQSLYLPGLAEFGAEISLLIVKRNIEAVVKSLQRRHPEMPVSQAEEIYHGHYRLYEQIDRPRYTIQFEDLVKAPADTMRGFCDFWDIEFEAERTVTEFVEGKLVHG